MKRIKSLVLIFIFCISICFGASNSVKAGDITSDNTVNSEVSYSDETGQSARGIYLGSGSSSISKAGTGKIAAGGTTIAQKVVSTVSVTVRVERLVNGVWQTYTSWSATRYNAASASSSKTLSVPTGYYYRTHSFHYANSDASSSITNGIWI